MSLMGTLAKVAIGVAVAKGASSLAKSGRSASGGSAGAGGLGDMMGAILGGGSSTGSVAGGLGGLLDELGGMGAGTTTSRRTATTHRRKTQEPDLGAILGQLTGTTGGSARATGGIGDLIGSLATAGAAGGIGGLLGGMLSGGGLGSSLNSALANGGEPDSTPAPAQELAAALLLKAMIQAAKADGQIDAGEQQKLMAKLGEVTDAEKAFVQQELAAPVDVEGLARQIPEGLEAQAYTMSVMAIDLDSQAEAQYLHQFATALGLQPAEVNHIHDQLGVPKLYA